MTYDELLQKVDDEVSNCIGLMAGAILGDALTAVIKLHKPEHVGLIDGLGCMTCRMGAPCSTLKIIEEQLWEA
jgi:hypothetical protein